ncbi:hypothetical protein MRB53_025058 [Persea americana]|uniref:Uncharacterized protein n=1 Tax=Persea americana TaxID=3435 RepID=A0ACC2LEH1_PERAE|nr:hypothetical protein MRB53_025058 [Persea americana]
MSGVWVFKNGVARLISNPTKDRRVLVYVPSNQVIRSYADLEQRLFELGWEPYEPGRSTDLIQYHRSSSTAHLISLPKDFKNFRSTHMYDIVVKNRYSFEVRNQPN